MKTCIACGMPMEKPEDFAMGDITKDYCVHCAAADGTMKTFEEAKQGMINFIVKTQGLDEAVAEKATLNAMKAQPAWKEHFNK